MRLPLHDLPALDEAIAWLAELVDDLDVAPAEIGLVLDVAHAKGADVDFVHGLVVAPDPLSPSTPASWTANTTSPTSIRCSARPRRRIP